MGERLAQQRQQTQAALAQVSLVRDQLQAETAARLQAQHSSNQLLVHNRQLLEHVQTLIGELQALEAAPPDAASPDASSTSLSSEEARRPAAGPDRHRLPTTTGGGTHHSHAARVRDLAK
ncbi:carboxyl-terminal PDZ ligand of neuronal nitric oxide synthase protein-like [Pollicipes pollicipes]|uniref:carboxyl-terminal PDZ ligand of neuronal nitric oxide synthase protein-like n=1 Tax=Pollicipes pollicipes TaxID=41117 RepID=UPI0018855B5D|nr:carboxyl-terminal PDZ ligand of neuronal nitric oxide synthase protein-like [Pollicipes pollicipes]